MYSKILFNRETWITPNYYSSIHFPTTFRRFVFESHRINMIKFKEKKKKTKGKTICLNDFIKKTQVYKNKIK